MVLLGLPIEAELSLTSSTGLVEEVKRFMTEFGAKVQMPSPPLRPSLTESFKAEEERNVCWKSQVNLLNLLKPKEPEKPTFGSSV